MAISAKVDIKEVQQKLSKLSRSTPAALKAAMKSSVAETRKDAVRLIAKDINRTQTDVNAMVTAGSVSGRNPEVTIKVSSRRDPLIKWAKGNIRPSNRRTSGGGIRIDTGRGAKVIRGAFVAFSQKMGRLGIFKRTSNRRLPIIELQGPPAGKAFIHLRGKVGEMFASRLPGLITGQLKRGLR